MPGPKRDGRAAEQPRFRHFEAWYGASEGHQRAERTLPVVAGWKQSRSVRVTEEFKRDVGGDGGGGERYLEGKTAEGTTSTTEGNASEKTSEKTSEGKTPSELTETAPSSRGIFDGLVIYINGSTYPLISDYKLKQVLVDNGAKLSLHLARRQVTHVILGKPGTRGAGAGGGLAGSKLEREIKRVGGCGVKYVNVQW